MTENKSNWNVFLRTMAFLGKRTIPYFIGIIGLTVTIAGISIITAIIAERVIDGVMAGNMDFIRSVVYLGLAGILISCVLRQLFMYLYNSQGRRTNARLRGAIMNKIGRLPASYFENTNTGDLVSRLLYDANRMGEVYASRFRRFIAPTISLVTFLIPMLLIDWRITLGMVGVNFIVIFVNRKFAKPIEQSSTRLSKATGILSERLLAILSGMHLVRMFGATDKIQNKYSSDNDDFTQKGKARAKYSALLSGANAGFGVIGVFVFLIIGAAMAQIGLTTIGRIVALASLQGHLTYNFLQLGQYFPELFDYLASARRILELLDHPEEPERYELAPIKSDSFIEMKNVSFSYDGERNMLSNFNFKVERGIKTALVGASGSGKSTVAKLLMGLYSPSGGSLYIDGKNVSERTLAENRELISYVPQESYLYNISIKENIRYGKPNSSNEEIIEAAKAANAHDFIMALPDGYNTIAGERGNRLSGGQRQRIAIARAVIKNAPILLLDEATSALDNESEQLINKAITRLANSRTVIMIAHRQSTIDSADEIINVT